MTGLRSCEPIDVSFATLNLPEKRIWKPSSPLEHRCELSLFYRMDSRADCADGDVIGVPSSWDVRRASAIGGTGRRSPRLPCV